MEKYHFVRIMKYRIPLFSLLLLSTSGLFAAEALTDLQNLGKSIFFDPTLSEPAGQSCASCHDPGHGFADPDQHLPTSEGVIKGLFGSRNTPSVAYAAFSPELFFDPEEEHFVGGQFLDGRSANLEEQAQGPFLNPVEMANPDIKSVVRKIRKAPYAAKFDKIFGSGALKYTDVAYDHIASAIAAYQRSSEVNQFTSKYDYYLAGKAALTAEERFGLELFEAEDKGNCAACHISKSENTDMPPLFTDFTYDNLGVPKNPENPIYKMDKQFNPYGDAIVDKGLGASIRVGRSEHNGKFKVNTLRNIDKTAPYMHNGVFATLKEVVDFYNTRDVSDKWGEPEVSENINNEELGDLKLSDEEVDAIVAFMKTLTDGFQVDSKTK